MYVVSTWRFTISGENWVATRISGVMHATEVFQSNLGHRTREMQRFVNVQLDSEHSRNAT